MSTCLGGENVLETLIPTTVGRKYLVQIEFGLLEDACVSRPDLRTQRVLLFAGVIVVICLRLPQVPATESSSKYLEGAEVFTWELSRQNGRETQLLPHRPACEEDMQ